MYYAGIDLGLETSAVCVIDAHGRRGRECTVATNEAALREALRGFGRLRVIIEAGASSEWVKRRVDAAGHSCRIIDSRAAKQLMSSAKKTDRRDAHTLAEIGRGGWYNAVHCKSDRARELRTWLQARNGLLEVMRAQDSRIRGLLRGYGVPLGQVGAARYERRVRERLEAHAPQLWPCIRPLLESWRHAREQARALKKSIERWARELPGAREMLSVPGLGPIFTTTLVATIDDPSRFRDPKEVGSYVGLVPWVHQSGQRDSRGRITRKGDGVCRAVAVEAATVLMRRYRGDCALKRWALRLEAEKGFGKARVALARKLVVLACTLWQRGERFDPERGMAGV